MTWEKEEPRQRTIEDDFCSACLFPLVQAKKEIINIANRKEEPFKDFSVIPDYRKTEILIKAISAVFKIQLEGANQDDGLEQKT
jgi:hypothetical protein